MRKLQLILALLIVFTMVVSAWRPRRARRTCGTGSPKRPQPKNLRPKNLRPKNLAEDLLRKNLQKNRQPKSLRRRAPFKEASWP